MPFVNPPDCNNLPFKPMGTTKAQHFALPTENTVYGYRRVARAQPGNWAFQPCYSLYRVIINTAKKTFFNSAGITLPESASSLYLPQINQLAEKFPNRWLDGFIRVTRTGEDDVSYGQGSFLINDIFIPGVPFWDRAAMLSSKLPELGICRKLPSRSLYKVPNFPEHVSIALWAALIEVQARWDVKKDYHYKGMVAKEVKSSYIPRGSAADPSVWLEYPFVTAPAEEAQPAMSSILHALESK